MEYTKEDIVTIAKHHRTLHVVFIAGLVTAVALGGIAMLMWPVIGIFMFLLASRLKLANAWLWGLLAIIPLVGLVSLFILLNKAGKVLKNEGYKTGILGAKLNLINPLEQRR